MEERTSRHGLSSLPYEDGILVTCACGWEVWSRTDLSSAGVRRAEEHIGGQHLAAVDALPAPRRDVLVALGALVFMVCTTIVVVYLIWSM